MQIFKLISTIMFALTIIIALVTYFNEELKYNPIVIITALIFLAIALLMRFIAWRIERNLRD